MEIYEVEWGLPTHSPLCYVYIPKDPLLHFPQCTAEDTEIASGSVTYLRQQSNNQSWVYKTWPQAHLFGWLGFCLKNDIPDSLLFKSNGDVSWCTTHWVTTVYYPFCILAATGRRRELREVRFTVCRLMVTPCVCFSNCQPMGGLDPVIGKDKGTCGCLFSG